MRKHLRQIPLSLCNIIPEVDIPPPLSLTHVGQSTQEPEMRTFMVILQAPSQEVGRLNLILDFPTLAENYSYKEIAQTYQSGEFFPPVLFLLRPSSQNNAWHITEWGKCVEDV